MTSPSLNRNLDQNKESKRAGAKRRLPSYYKKMTSGKGQNEKISRFWHSLHGFWHVSYALSQRQAGGIFADPDPGGGRVFLPYGLRVAIRGRGKKRKTRTKKSLQDLTCRDFNIPIRVLIKP